MNLRTPEVKEITNSVSNLLESEDPDVDAGIFPPAVYLPLVLEEAGSALDVGAQNCHFEENGSFTGEISPWMVKDVGANWVIVGHSERRHDFGEDHPFLQKKVASAVEADLNVIYCIGETEDQRDAGQTQDTVIEQLNAGLNDTGVFDSDRELIIAYEPVWAIGTGRSAEPEQAQEVHEWIRDWIADQAGSEQAESVRLQYGGSVKPHNAESILAMNDVDGALIGGASLDSESFTDIIRIANS
jgi:triosephosphate isomerase